MAAPPNGRQLRAQLQKLIRRLGVLSDEQTPCGKDLPVSDAHALHLLREHGPLPQSALEALLGIDKSSVSRLRARLEAAGRIEGVASRDHGRPITVLRMTAAGRNLAHKLDAASGERFATLLRHIPADKRGRVLGALDTLNAALAAIDPTGATAAAALAKARSVVESEDGIFSRREKEVMRLAEEGLSSAEIAERLAIGKRTVETHRLHARRKLRRR